MRLMTHRFVFCAPLLAAAIVALPPCVAEAKKSAKAKSPPAAAAPAPSPDAAAPAAAPAAAAPAAAVAAPAPASAGEAAPPTAPAADPNVRLHLVAARELVAQGRGEAALAELDLEAQEPGGTPATQLDALALKAEALLLQKSPDETNARAAMIEVLRRDPEGTRFIELRAGAARSILDRLRDETVIVVHTPPAAARPGLPVKLRARLLDPKDKSAGMTLHFRGGAVSAWAKDPMKKDVSGAGYSGLVRDPTVLAPPGVTDGFAFDYYLTAEDAFGAALDGMGSAEKPLSLRVDSSAFKEEPAQALPATLPTPISERPVAVAEKPWYLRWYTLTAAGVVVAGVVTAIVVGATAEPELKPSLGIITLE